MSSPESVVAMRRLPMRIYPSAQCGTCARCSTGSRSRGLCPCCGIRRAACKPTARKPIVMCRIGAIWASRISRRFPVVSQRAGVLLPYSARRALVFDYCEENNDAEFLQEFWDKVREIDPRQGADEASRGGGGAARIYSSRLRAGLYEAQNHQVDQGGEPAAEASALLRTACAAKQS